MLADGFHSTDVDVGPQIEGMFMHRLLDDYFNVQNSLLFAMGGASAANELTVVHPHTNDMLIDGHTDLWYGTSEPLQRVRPGSTLRFFDPISFDLLGEVEVAATPVQQDASLDTALGQQADSLYNNVSQPPYQFVQFEPERYKVQHFRSSVYAVQLVKAPPASPHPELPVPYIVAIGQTRCTGAVVKDSTFVQSTGLFGRWKSSFSTIQNNTFGLISYIWRCK